MFFTRHPLASFAVQHLLQLHDVKHMSTQCQGLKRALKSASRGAFSLLLTHESVACELLHGELFQLVFFQVIAQLQNCHASFPNCHWSSPEKTCANMSNTSASFRISPSLQTRLQPSSHLLVTAIQSLMLLCRSASL